MESMHNFIILWPHSYHSKYAPVVKLPASCHTLLRTSHSYCDTVYIHNATFVLLLATSVYTHPSNINLIQCCTCMVTNIIANLELNHVTYIHHVALMAASFTQASSRSLMFPQLSLDHVRIQRYITHNNRNLHT